MKTHYSSSSLRLLAARAVDVLGSYVLERIGVDSSMQDKRKRSSY